jgi:hypothetical protein
MGANRQLNDWDIYDDTGYTTWYVLLADPQLRVDLEGMMYKNTISFVTTRTSAFLLLHTTQLMRELSQCNTVPLVIF